METQLEVGSTRGWLSYDYHTCLYAVIGIGAIGIINSVKENTNHDEVIARVQTEKEVIDTSRRTYRNQRNRQLQHHDFKWNRSAKAVVPIKGPNGKGEIYVTTTGPKENPVYEQLEVYIFDEDRIIQLLDKAPDDDF